MADDVTDGAFDNTEAEEHVVMNWQPVMVEMMHGLRFTMDKLGEVKAQMEDNTAAIVEMRSQQKTANFIMPSFTGVDEESIEEWVSSCEQLFRVHKVTDDLMKAEWLGLGLKGVAHCWYRKESPETKNNYEAIREAILLHFKENKNGFSLRKELESIKMNGNLKQYKKEFQVVISKIENISEEDKVYAFINNLDSELSKEVFRGKPKTLNEAFAEAENSFRLNPKPAVEINAMAKGVTSSTKSNFERPRIRCYNCGYFGHSSRFCRYPKRNLNKEKEIKKILITLDLFALLKKERIN